MLLEELSTFFYKSIQQSQCYSLEVLFRDTRPGVLWDPKGVTEERCGEILNWRNLEKVSANPNKIQTWKNRDALKPGSIYKPDYLISMQSHVLSRAKNLTQC